jgi:hypothetical protein
MPEIEPPGEDWLMWLRLLSVPTVERLGFKVLGLGFEVWGLGSGI